MDSVNVRDINADGNARIHVGNSSVTHIHNYAEGQGQLESTPEPFSLIPFSRDPDFVPRGDLLSRISAQCAQPGGRAALVGLGGVGKSQLAIEYAYQTADIARVGRTWVFWVHAGTRARVEEGFRAIADAVKLPDRHLPRSDVPRLLCSWLSNEKNGRWLLVLDSADEYDVFYGAEPGKSQPLASYLPQSPNGAILVTTRDHRLAVRLAGDHRSAIQVGPMTPDEAILFLEKKLGVSSEPELAAELVATLDCIPLAINQAASYIQARSPRCTVQKYLVEFRASEKKSARLLAHDSAELRRDGSASNAIMKTWHISFDHIRSKQPSAADLLSLMSFFDNQSIPESALNPEDEYDSGCESDLESNWASEDLANHATMKTLMRAKQRRENIDNSDDDDLQSEAGFGFEDDIALLRDYSLISICESGTQFEMHRLVQLATKKWLAGSKRQEEFKQLFIHRLSLSPPVFEELNERNIRGIFSHLHTAINYRPNKTNLRCWYYMSCRIAHYLEYLGQYSKAKAIVETALQAWESRKGAKHYDVLAGKTLLAGLIFGVDQSQATRSEALLLDVLEVTKEANSPDSEVVLSAMASLAAFYRQQGRMAEAEKLGLYVLEKQRFAAGLENKATLNYMSALAVTYFDQSRFKEAEELELESLAISKKVHGPHHDETLSRIVSLSETYSQQSRYEESVELSLQALQLVQSASDQVEDQMCLQIKAQLAKDYYRSHLFDKSMDLNTEMLQTLTSKLGPGHVHTLDCMMRLARDYTHNHDFAKAEQILQCALENARLHHGNAHDKTQGLLQRLSLIYSLQGHEKEAEKLLSDSLTLQMAESGPVHLDTLSIQLDLAMFYQTAGQTQKSEPLFSQAFFSYRNNYDLDQLAELNCWQRLAEAEFSQSDMYSELGKLIEDLLAIRQDRHGPKYSSTMLLLTDLARVKESMNLWDDAAGIRLRILEYHEEKNGKTHATTLSHMSNLVAVRKAQGRIAEARELQDYITSSYQSTLGLSNIHTLQSMQELASLLFKQGDFPEAERTAREALRLTEATYGREHLGTLNSLRGLAHMVAEQAILEESRRDEAMRLLEEHQHLYKVAFPDCEMGHSTSLINMAFALDKMDMNEYAELCFVEAFASRESLLGPDDPDTLWAMLFVASVWDGNGKWVQSVALQKECMARCERVCGPDHEVTVAALSKYEQWVREFEEHDEEHAGEAGHPFETCEACIASRNIRGETWPPSAATTPTAL